MAGIEIKMVLKLPMPKLNSIIGFLALFISTGSFGQVDSSSTSSVPIPNAEYAVYVYDSTLKTKILTYQYHDLGDLDGDGKWDSIAFIGNGGAHTYFHLRVQLSSSGTWTVYPTFSIDMPYWNKDKPCDSYFQFAVCDFDHDGLDEIYLDIDNPFGHIPQHLKDEELTSKQLLVEFRKGNLRVKDFE